MLDLARLPALTPSARRLRTPGGRGVLLGATVWLAPILALSVIYFSPRHLVSANTALGGLVLLGVVALAVRRPDRAMIALIVLLPFQGFVLSRLWAWGLPVSLVRHLGAWKEALALGVVVAGARNFVASERRLDTLDRLGLGFVAVAALYLLAQHAIVPSSPASSSIRLLGFREDAGFVILLLGAKHAPFPPGFLDRAGKAVLLVGAVVAGIAVFEALDSVAWNQFVVKTIGYTHYQQSVLNVIPQNLGDIRIYGTIGGTSIIRSGSVFLNAVNCGFYLVLSFAVGVERVARGQARPWVMLSLLLVSAGLVLTQTRSAILAALIVAIIAFQPAAGRGAQRRTQLRLLIAGLVVLAIPAALATGLALRLANASSSKDTSTAGHVVGFWDGVNAIEKHPFGQGLGTSAGTGQRFQAELTDVVVPENNYLQFGAELGVIPMLLFMALTVALVLALRRAARRRPSVMTGAAWTAAAGLAVGAWFLQTWSDFGVAWTFWGLAGAVLSVAAARSAQPDGPVREAGDRSHEARTHGPAHGSSRAGVARPVAGERR